MEMREDIRAMPAANPAALSLGGMYNETREMLQTFYRPFNQELAAILGDERFTWGY